MPSPPGKPGRRGWLRRAFDLNRSPLPYLLPTLLFIGVFLAYPIFDVIRQSFEHNVPIRPWEAQGFVGFDNYVTLFKSAAFRRALLVTVSWTVLSRSEEHTSELQSRGHLVCRLLLEKKKRYS